MRLLITGASGQLGGYLLRELAEADARVIAWSGSRTGQLLGVPLRPVNLTQPEVVSKAFREARPDVVIHGAAVTRIADAFRDPAHCRLVNVEGTATLADEAEKAGALFVLLSTDLVFDGSKGSYRESDPPAPLSVYARTKVESEAAAAACSQRAVARASLLYGPSIVGRPSFFDEQVAAFRTNRPLTLFEDEWRTPLSLAAAARSLLAIARSDFRGLIHLGGPERLSRLEMGMRLADHLGTGHDVITRATREHTPSPEPRPRDTSLDSSLWRKHFPEQAWPDLPESLREMSLF
jgi:dTDP-4-dehydrorhamnose reductase